MKKDFLPENITLKSIQLVFRSSPAMCRAFIAFELVFCLIPIFSAKAISQIVTIFGTLSVSKYTDLMQVVIFYITMNVGMQVLFPIRNHISKKLSNKVAKDSEMMFNSKVTSFHSVYCFENNEFYNEMKLIRNGCGIRLISSLQKLIEKKKTIKQGTMQELFTGKKRLPGFSVEWSQALFEDLFDFLPTNAFTRDQMTDTGTIQNVHYGDILTKYGACLDMANTDVPYLLETVSVRKYSESSYVREGDVIIADTAEDSTVGKCVELVNVCGKVLSGQHTMLCRPKITFAPKFLGYYMNAECFHNQMLPFITGIKVSSISKANISTLVLKYPTLVEEQQAIAQVFSDMDEEIAQLEKKLAKYQQIKQGMMQELLTGRIRLV